MKQYTITVSTLNNKKIPLYQKTVKAESKQEAWDMVKKEIKTVLEMTGFIVEIKIEEGK